jgi:hypothetical protein
MITNAQKSDLLFKKYLGKGGTGESFEYYNEPLDGRPSVYPNQIWSDYDLIPVPAATYPLVVDRLIDVGLSPIPGHTNSFSASLLVGAIPFNFSEDRSYLPTLKKSTGDEIPFTDPSDWFLDGEAGIITFYGGLPSGVSDTNPPSMSFWRYIGQKGSGGGGGGSNRGYVITASISQDQFTASYALSASRADTASYIYGAKFKDYMSGQIEYPTVDNVYFLIANNPSPLEIDYLTMALYSGYGSASLKVDNIPVVGLDNVPIPTLENTFYPTNPPVLVQSGSRLILELNNMSVGAGRFYFTIGLNRTLI